MDLESASAYARKHKLDALLVARGDEILVETYVAPFAADTPHALYSGTKSFWGIAAICAQHDGIIDLDAPIGATLAQLRDSRATVTARQLLSLIAGYGFGGLGNAVPIYEKALSIPLKDSPGTTFTYGGIPLQVFGAYFAQRLASRNQTPHEYLTERILQPAHVTIGSWRTLGDGTHPLPTGAFVTGRNWLRYGQYVLQHVRDFADALHGSAPNPRYGLAWWLGAAGAPDDAFYASGSAGQGLYIVPSHDTVAVHFGQSASFKHEAFLRRLFA